MLLTALCFAASTQAQIFRPSSIERWDEAIPLGNGIMGGLLWGSGTSIRLSLDRGDLWDLRPAPGTERPDFNYENMKKWVAEGRKEKLDDFFDSPYNHPYPTKIPAGRLEFEGIDVTDFSLNLRTAEGSSSKKADVFFSADRPVAMLRFHGPVPRHRLIVPAALAKLGYDVAQPRVEGPRTYFVQKAAAGLSYCVAVEVRESTVAVSIATNAKGDPKQEAFKELDRALDSGYGREFARHKSWWNEFWRTSEVYLPDPKLQEHYDLVKYFYGSASRKGAPPMPLQGVWTADDGNLPPWKGDYHNDLNTQTTYLPFATAGLFESGASWTEFNWKLLPTYKRFARRFYGVKGAVVPGVMTLNGEPLAGWGMYALSPTNGAWICHQFERQWQMSGDREFLKSRAYPFCSEIGTALSELLDAEGRLPLSSSPEIHDNTLRAWLEPNSTYDGELMRWLFGSLADMATELGRKEDSVKWQTLQRKVPPSELDPDDKGFAFSKGEYYRESHRHFSHALAVHPLGTERGATAEATVDRIARHGTHAWTGYSFAWFAGMLARMNRPDESVRYLSDFERAFILANGFHVNGDQTKSGLSGFTYRPFTLEGNFLFMDAVHEMLIRTENKILKLFPAVPSKWGSVGFRDIRAEGGFKVTAQREKGRTVWMRIEATRDATLTLNDPFSSIATWSSKIEFKEGTARIPLKRGEILEGKVLHYEF